MNILKAFLISTLAIFVGSSCSRYHDTYNVSKRELPANAQKMNDNEIETLILRAASRSKWICTQAGLKTLNCSVANVKHPAKIQIIYTHQDFSISHVNAGHLDQSDHQVHRNYNKWIKRLEKTILNTFIKKSQRDNL